MQQNMTTLDSFERPLLEARALSVSIGGVRVVEDLDLNLAPGESVGILGPNGIGKSTLLLVLAGIRRPQRGAIRLDSEPLAEMDRRRAARKLGMLTQNTRFAFDASCLEVALSGRHPHLGTLARESAVDYRRAEDALEAVDLAALKDRSCRALSGGEQRRLALARVLTQDPEVLLLDEPTNQLDPAHQVAVLDHLWHRNRRGRGAQLMAIHDLNLATCYCDRVLLLHGDGRWALGPSSEMLTEQRLGALFGCPIRRISDGEQTVFAVAAKPAPDA
jgi:iron complex transport system ATP-binding protein